jgi:hypothetical protein
MFLQVLPQLLLNVGVEVEVGMVNAPQLIRDQEAEVVLM